MSSTLQSFMQNPDMSVRLHFHGLDQKLYVIDHGSFGIPIQSWSGGGGTNALNVKRRLEVEKLHHTHVPTSDDLWNSYRPASKEKINVVNHKGKTSSVPKVRGGMLPAGQWIAVAQGAKEFRPPTHSLGELLWHLHPSDVHADYARAGREMQTFYIHIAGFLGSDGCIVMSNDNLQSLKRALRGRPYTHLKCEFHSTIFGEIRTVA